MTVPATSFSSACSRHRTGAFLLKLRKFLSKLGVSVIESNGKEFDPNLHNAIMHEDDETQGENIITQTFQTGYMLGEKVIRHAMVKVVN